MLVSVIEAVSAFTNSVFNNSKQLSPNEVSFNSLVQLTETSLVNRIKWDVDLRTLTASVAPAGPALPEHDGLENLFHLINKARNPKYEGKFFPLFIEGSEAGSILPAYSACLRVQGTFKFKQLQRFILDSVYRGALGGLVFWSGQDHKESYPSAQMIEFLLLEHPKTKFH